MEIIIHGKPLSESAVATSGIDVDLKERITSSFFTEKSKSSGKECLYVEAYRWKGTWYSVYTYLLCDGIQDTANRPSYFAMSLINANRYCCVVSDVFNLLRSITSKCVQGKILDNSGKYLTTTLDVKEVCQSILAEVNCFDSLVEKFDDQFDIVQEFKSDFCYNTIDCDSKAFVRDWRKHGRIIVSDSALSKDALAGQNADALKQWQNSQNIIQQKDAQITSLQNQLAEFTKLGGSNQQKITELESEKKALEQTIETLLAQISLDQEFRKAISDALARFPNGIAVSSNKKDDGHDSKSNAFDMSILRRYASLILASIILSLFLLFVLFFRPDGKKTEPLPQLTEQKQNKEPSRVLYMESHETKQEIAPVEEPESQTLEYADCNLRICNSKNKEISSAKVGDTIIALFDKHDGYEIHHSEQLESIGSMGDGSFRVLAKTVGTAIITYRSIQEQGTITPNKKEIIIKKQ